MYIKSIKKMMEDLKIPISLENIHKLIKSQRNVNKYVKSLYITYNNNIENIINREYPLYHNGYEVGKCNINSCEITTNTSKRIIKEEEENDKKAPAPPIEDCLCKDIRYCLLDDNNQYQCSSIYIYNNIIIIRQFSQFYNEWKIQWF